MDDILDTFNTCKKKGWIKGTRKGNNAVGVTFEKMIGLKENSSPLADFNGIEIKTKYSKQFSNITMFCCFPCNWDAMDNFVNILGRPDKTIESSKVLYLTLYANTISCLKNKYYIKVHIDNSTDQIKIKVLDKSGNKLSELYWTFDKIKRRLSGKISNIAFLDAIQKTKNGVQYFKYIRLRFYKLKSKEVFFDLLNKGIIYIVINVGVYKSGKNVGNPHYHGINFCIDERNIELLYKKVLEVS